MTAHAAGPVIVLLSASDTDLLAARSSGGRWRLANPARTEPAGVAALLDGAFCVVVRLLGRRRSSEAGDIRMNCDTCAYRVAMPGFADKVGLPQTPHFHPADAALARSHHDAH